MNSFPPVSRISGPSASALAVPELLVAVAGPHPCGACLRLDAGYVSLGQRLATRAEVPYGKLRGCAQVSIWTDIERDCRRLLLRSKDITLLVWLCRAWARLRHAAGLAQALATLSAVLKAWPAAVHPQATASGQVEPDRRASALAALGDPEGLLGDVRDIAVASSTSLRLNVRDVERVYAVPHCPDAPIPESVARQLAALRAIAQDDPEAPVNLLAQAAAEARAIEAWSRGHLGAQSPVELRDLVRLLAPFGATPERPASRSHASASVSASASASARSVPASIMKASIQSIQSVERTRAEVVGSISAAREWLDIHEPGSAVAALLRQAENRAGMREREEGE